MIVPFCLAYVSGTVAGQTTAWAPSSGHTQVPIWPKEPPNAQPVPGPEAMKTVKDPLISDGKPWIQIDNVSRPTITVYSPEGRNSGAAVIVFPGGGYKVLAIDLQGTEVCQWLTSKGITAVLLKYRVPTERVGPYQESLLALQDAQRAMGLVRSHAAEWHIDPHKIGVIGFSAGGHMVAALSTHFEKRSYPAVDAADNESCRPDFAIALYPGHLSDPSDEDSLGLNPSVQVTSKAPPTFLLQAEDDPVDPVSNSLVYYVALKKAGVPVEMHLYAQGGHAFGVRPTSLPIGQWPHLVETWLRTIKMVSP